MILLAVSGTVAAQGGKQPWEEYDKLINKRKAVTTLGPQLFGDQVDLATGTLSFTTTDVSVPGNNALPVAVTRTFAVHSDKEGGYPFGDWDIDIPNISGLFAPDWHNNRCDTAAPPSKSVHGSTTGASVGGTRYWSGNRASMPGGGELLGLPAGSPRPSTGGPYVLTTPGRTVFSCIGTSTSNIKNYTGQGFLAVTTDGTKYWFDHMAQSATASHEHTWQVFNSDNPYDTNPKAKYESGTLVRKKNALYVTRVEDRFGNSVTYTYSNAYNQPLKIDSITSSDQRSISFHYNGSVIDSVTSGGRTWTYQYGTTGLTGVVLPDGGRWTIAIPQFSKAEIEYLGTADPNWRTCYRPGAPDAVSYTGTITHPSGAVGTFTIAPTIHARSNVPALCENYVPQSASNNYNDPTNDYAIFPIRWHGLSLTSKQITGPGLPTQYWSFDYSSAVSWFFPEGQTEPYKCDSVTCADPICVSDACAGVAKTTIIGPDGEWTRHTFGNSYRYNEGKLLKVEVGLNETQILSTTTHTYDLALSGQPYAARVGNSAHPYADGFTSEFPRPQVSTVVFQQDVSFTSTVDTGCVTPTTAYCLDNFLRPTRHKRFSSLGGLTKFDTTEYLDNTSSWVLGQVSKQSTNGIETARTEYHTTSLLPIRSYSFGILQHTLSYNTDGTLATVTDGRSNTTTLSSWKRGIPQTITHPGVPVVTEKAFVNDRGNPDWVEDELTTRTSYTYDAMDRLSGIAYPTGDSTLWNGTTLPFVAVTVPEYGLPAGHWKQTVQTGNGKTITFYDAQWRAVLTLTQEGSSNVSFVVNRYDAGGRLVFTSYPVANLTSVNDVLKGTTTEYDVLGRATKVKQDSELGLLTSTMEYLPGFVTRNTNARLAPTTTSYQVFDSPDTSRPVLIQAPEGVVTTITRDVFGKPLTVTRSGPKG